MKRLLAVLWLSGMGFLGTAASADTPTPWNVRDAGAVGDGQADCTALFQKLLDEAGKAGGGVVEVPAGRFRMNGHLVIPANVTLQGIFRSAPTAGPNQPDKLSGSVLLAYEGRGSREGAPFIRLAGNNAALAGVVIAYPEWKQTDVPPVPYPPCVLAQNADNVSVQDCCLLNPYEGIKLIRAGRHLVRNVTGYPIQRGLYVDECYDIGRIENVHFWPFGVHYKADDPFCKWVNTEGVAFELARTDWHYVHNTFCFGYGVGYKFSQSKQGSANGNFLGLGADSCTRAVLVEQAQPPGLLISNGEFVGRWGSTNSVCLEIGPEVAGKVSLVNCSFWGPIDRCVWMRAPGGQFTADACHFLDWDTAAQGSPAIQIDAGKAIIQGNTFNHSLTHVAVSSNALSVIATANQAEGGFRLKNAAGKRVQSALNETADLDWPKEARLHYVIEVGQPGDGRFLENWYGGEAVNGSHWRWSRSRSGILLPVATNQAYTVSVELSAPAQALATGAGLFYRGKQLSELKSGVPVSATIPAGDQEMMELELRCQGWQPSQWNKGSTDQRVLGVQLKRIVVKATGHTGPPANGNTATAR